MVRRHTHVASTRPQERASVPGHVGHRKGRLCFRPGQCFLRPWGCIHAGRAVDLVQLGHIEAVTPPVKMENIRKKQTTEKDMLSSSPKSIRREKRLGQCQEKQVCTSTDFSENDH